MDSALWALVGAGVTATVTGIAIVVQLGTGNKERLEAIYERLLSQLNEIVRELGNWDGQGYLPAEKRRTISRMLHMHLDSLVESIAVEGRSRVRGLLYRLSRKRMYRRLGGNEGKWFIASHRYLRFEYWYSSTLVLYKQIMEHDNYVLEVFHLVPDRQDVHSTVESLDDCFKEYLEIERTRRQQWCMKK